MFESDIDCLGSQCRVGVLVALLQNISCNQFSSAEQSLTGTAAD